MVYRSWSCSRGRFPPERELVRSLAAIHRGFPPDGLNCKVGYIVFRACKES